MFRCCVLVAVILMTLSSITQALIVPQELPSILSLVYSNIPPIRKGTDSRLGFGFRLGEHADFQVVVELGPQKETRPLGMNQDDDDSSNSKRQVNQNDYKKIRRMATRPRPRTTTTTTTARPLWSTESPNDYAWLRDWFSEWTGFKSRDNNNSNTNTNANNNNHSRKPSKIQNKNFINEIVTKKGYVKTVPIIPESSLRQLQQLYKMATMEPIVVEDTTPNPSSSVGINDERMNEILSNTPSRLSIISRFREMPSAPESGPSVGPASAPTSAPVPAPSSAPVLVPAPAPTPTRKTKGEITDELMDVNLAE
ncbi:transcription factor stalky [Eupeodes corollae]|uniref:transcription factor stalky n=1 Tax=Eupeodes corollae TaxID=290404 RepID=UPI0024929735|nr:transcription factor stalky [Eupeodes corollae]